MLIIIIIDSWLIIYHPIANESIDYSVCWHPFRGTSVIDNLFVLAPARLVTQHAVGNAPILPMAAPSHIN